MGLSSSVVTPAPLPCRLFSGTLEVLCKTVLLTSSTDSGLGRESRHPVPQGPTFCCPLYSSSLRGFCHPQGYKRVPGTNVRCPLWKTLCHSPTCCLFRVFGCFIGCHQSAVPGAEQPQDRDARCLPLRPALCLPSILILCICSPLPRGQEASPRISVLLISSTDLYRAY